ncbi:MAG: hypothetical protein FWD06_00260 [Oscillospiraceae bacterium]|nr:hypothetical protein [Oscillospiraceae bacterium]
MTTDLFLTSLYGGLGLSMLHAPLAIGIFLSLRIMKKPDLTIEGSFGFGAVLAMTMLHNEHHFIIALLVAMLGGAVAGLATALIHTKLKIDGIISGLLVTMALFSINLFVMDSSNISAPMDRFIFTPVRDQLVTWGVPTFNAWLWSQAIVGAAVLAVVITVLYLLYNTAFGLSIRATGDNERMACSNGINTDSRKLAALIIANAISGLSGALVAQQLNGANVNSGVGTLIIGLAALVIGEVITPKRAGMLTRFLFITLGSFIYFACISLITAAQILDTTWTRLLTAVLTLLALCVPKLRQLVPAWIAKLRQWLRARKGVAA